MVGISRPMCKLLSIPTYCTGLNNSAMYHPGFLRTLTLWSLTFLWATVRAYADLLSLDVKDVLIMHGGRSCTTVQLPVILQPNTLYR